jgi:hypothetical protein
MGIEEEEMQAKGIHKILNKIITENFPKLENAMPSQVKEALGQQTNLNKIAP